MLFLLAIFGGSDAAPWSTDGGGSSSTTSSYRQHMEHEYNQEDDSNDTWRLSSTLKKHEEGDHGHEVHAQEQQQLIKNNKLVTTSTSSNVQEDQPAILGEDEEDMIVPAFTLSELQLGTRDNDLLDVLTTTGLLAVRVPMSSTSTSTYQGTTTDKNKSPGETKGGSRTERRLLAELCQCGDKIGPHIQGGDKILLSDGVTTRSTIATATSGSRHPLPLPKKDIEDMCGLETFASLEQVRGYVSHAASNAFIPALDRLIQNKSSTSAAAAGGVLESSYSSSTILLSTKPETATTTTGTSGHRDYYTVTSIIEDAVHLEHFHVYSQVKKQEGDLQDNVFLDASSTSTASAAVVDHALDWHTDGGLFLAFLPAESCNQEGTARTNTEHDDSFRIKRKVHDPHSKKDSFTEVRAVFPQHRDDDGEVIVAIMLGEGAETWLNTPKSLKLRATRHAVKMRNGESRAWYGMMHLVPSDAIVVKSHGTTFSELRKTSKPHQQNIDVHDDGNSVASASFGDVFFDISSKQRRNLQHVGGPDECNNLDSFYCWLSCLEIPSGDEYSFQENVALGKSLYCLDPGTLNTTNDLSRAVAVCSNSTTGAAGGIMKMTCGNYWYDTDENVQTYTSLFTGDLSGGDVNNDTESSSGVERLKYCYGKTDMYMQGFEWEATTCLVYIFQTWVISSRLELVVACLGTIALGFLVEAIIRHRRHLLSNHRNGKKKMFWSATLYAAQLISSYLIMLLVMTYSGPLFISVIFGLVIGHVANNWFEITDETCSGSVAIEGSTPCCANFLEKVNDKESSYTENKQIQLGDKVKGNDCCHCL